LGNSGDVLEDVGVVPVNLKRFEGWYDRNSSVVPLASLVERRYARLRGLRRSIARTGN
jgi:hypothetical protein